MRVRVDLFIPLLLRELSFFILCVFIHRPVTLLSDQKFNQFNWFINSVFGVAAAPASCVEKKEIMNFPLDEKCGRVSLNSVCDDSFQIDGISFIARSVDEENILFMFI